MNLGRAVQAAFDEGLLLAGGGHAMAAGLTIRPDAIPEFRAFLTERLAQESVGRRRCRRPGDRRPDHARRCGPRFVERSFQRMAPFGPGNPEPTFATAAVRVERPMAVKWRPCPLPAGRRSDRRQAACGGLAVRRHRPRAPPAGWRRRPARGGPAEARRLVRPRWRGAGDRGCRRSPPAWLSPRGGRRKPRRLDLRAGPEWRYRAPPATRALRLSVRTSDFHSGKRGSTPLGPATLSTVRHSRRPRPIGATAGSRHSPSFACEMFAR